MLKNEIEKDSSHSSRKYIQGGDGNSKLLRYYFVSYSKSARRPGLIEIIRDLFSWYKLYSRSLPSSSGVHCQSQKSLLLVYDRND